MIGHTAVQRQPDASQLRGIRQLLGTPRAASGAAPKTYEAARWPERALAIGARRPMRREQLAGFLRGGVARAFPVDCQREPVGIRVALDAQRRGRRVHPPRAATRAATQGARDEVVRNRGLTSTRKAECMQKLISKELCCH